MSNAIYDCTDKYVITASCKGPLHVGSLSGDKGEVLINPVSGEPFIQATGINGVLRSYCLQITDKETVDVLFGSTEEDRESRIKVTDGIFTAGSNVSIELRPRVSIDPATGTVSSAQVKGGDKERSGQKFDMQYVAAGSEFSFEIYLYGGDNSEQELIKTVLSALKEGEIQIGGQKSNGCGYLKDVKVTHKHYDMRDKNDRMSWISETGLADMDLPELKPEDYINAYEITIKASTEGELLVKAIAPEGPEEDASNIRNAVGEYIIPGSSIKGSIRNRMDMIAEYMNIDSELIFDGFGKASETETDGRTGNLRFADIIVGEGVKDNTNLRTRTRIDKFTGGVRNQALFTELNVYGEMEIDIQVANRSNPEAVLALLMLAIRDLRYKLFSLGGGQSVGKGYLDITDIVIYDKRNKKTCHFNQDFAVTEGGEILDKCMEKLKEQTAA